MREAFETAPRDGKVVILEDDASGTYEAARWSAEAGEWVGEDGEPIKITPTHWYDSFPFSSSRAPPQPTTAGNVVALRSVVAAAPVTLEAFEAQTAPVEANPTPHARQRFAASSITATLDRYAGRYGIFGISMMGIFGMGMMGILGISMMGGQVAEQATQLPSDSDASSFSRDIAPQQRTNPIRPQRRRMHSSSRPWRRPRRKRANPWRRSSAQRFWRRKPGRRSCSSPFSRNANEQLR